MEIPVAFEDPTSKTLKWRLRPGYDAPTGVLMAKDFLVHHPEYSRIEFKDGKYYIVVARLKDEEK